MDWTDEDADLTLHEDRDVLCEFSSWLDKMLAAARRSLPHTENEFLAFKAARDKLDKLWGD